MQPTPTAWIDKAELALATARREFNATDQVNLDAVCLHAERCAERYLKARLLASNVPFPEYTRHLVILLELCLEQNPDWEPYRPHLRTLTTLAFNAEDPVRFTLPEEAERSLLLAQQFRDAARAGLGLSL